MSEECKYGEVVWFSAKRGIGFILQEDSEVDLFVHWSNIVCEGFRTLNKGQKVSYKTGENHRGPQAIEVVVLEEKIEGE